jgi:predicted nucleic acid-binding protein/GNAT superfamily N-acetyltransferase
MAEQYFIRRNFDDIFPFLDSIRAHADSERGALGFLPEAAYAEAARQRKLILLLSQGRDKISYVGHLLFGGIFPILRVRQISVAPKHRQHGHATTLLRTLIAQGEKESYLNIIANVATDLKNANSFYEKQGFLSSRLKAGGKTRNRTINVRILQLETPSLISYMAGLAQPKAIEILQPKKRSSDIPIYAIDLNVFFDVIKERSRSYDAGVVFEAAFNHQIRIAVTQEFISELKRTSNDPTNDPALSLAKRIPTLPIQEQSEIDHLVPIIAKTVFPERTTQQRLKPTDKSDILHLAHAVAAGASGYITSDAKILDSRDALMKEFKLDIIGLSEFVDLLDLPSDTEQRPPIQATKHFRIRVPAIAEVIAFLATEQISLEAYLEGISISDCRRYSVLDDRGLVGISLLKTSYGLDQPSRSVVCVHQEHPFSSTIADFLISEQVRHCSSKTACHLLMMDIPSHPITRRVALGQGFQTARGGASLVKMTLGQPVTAASWNKARLSVERLIGMKIQRECPRYDKPEVKITTAVGKSSKIGLFDLETLLSPTLFVLPKRKAVVVPITRTFAADLLGTDDQYSFLEVPEAHFLTRRTYFNTTRAARAMIRGAAIAFYESRKGGGRGAVVAVARIVDVTSIPIDSTPEALQRGAVVEDIGALTKSSRVLATTFDNLVALKNPVSFETLRQIGCVTGANFVSATPISAKHLTAIVDAGYADE